MKLSAITQKCLKGQGCTAAEALWLAQCAPLPRLFSSASTIREQFFGLQIEFCAIVNARSGACSEDCHYCSQSVHNQCEAEVYPLLSESALLADAAKHSASGVSRYGIVTSGATVRGQDFERLCDTIRRMCREFRLQTCASLGRFGVVELKKLKAAGLRRYHHNLETSREFYPKICSTHNWEERLDTIRAAQEAGLEVCSGGLFGLGESWEDRISLALTLRELAVECVPLNFLHAHAGTPMENQPPLSPEEALRIIAIYRHVLPKAALRICGGRPKILGERQSEIFSSGANAIMTGDYLTTSGINPESDQAMVEKLGLELNRRPSSIPSTQK